LTGGRGVDLVVDNVGAVTMERSLKAVRRGGRIVTVGSTSGPMLTIDNRMIFSKQLSLIGSTMGSTPDFQHAIEFLWSPAIQPHLPLLIDAIAPFEHGIEMMARLEAGEQSGKIVLMMK
jgi:zinc-binding alcohol dehydrogenase/oxidoreductase